MDYAPTPPSSADYGFINCRNFEDTCILLEIYGKILKTTDPMGLQLACETGKLHEYASGFVKIEEWWTTLMKNPYPMKEVAGLTSRMRS